MSDKHKGLGARGVALIQATLLDFQNGASTRELSSTTGYTVSSVVKTLKVFADRGDAAYLRGSCGSSTWFHKKHFNAMRRQAAAAAKKRERCSANKARARRVYTGPIDFEAMPVHLVVSAANAEPLRPAGPASVWDLAA